MLSRLASSTTLDDPSRGLSREQLRRVNEFKSRFLNMAAHELNTPLTPMRLQLHLLKSGSLGSLGPAQGRAVAILERNLNRLADLVQEILDVARLEGGGMKVRPENVALDGVVKEALDAYAAPAEAVGIHLDGAPPSGLEAWADRRRLTQVVYNLLSNAIKFTPGGGDVRIAARPGPKPGTVQIAVRDSGAGLDPEQRSRLFQPFVRLHEGTVSAGGTGLGLFICKGLMEAQGGDLEATSQGAGRGATFTLTLPAASAGPGGAVAFSVDRQDLARRLRELI